MSIHTTNGAAVKPLFVEPRTRWNAGRHEQHMRLAIQAARRAAQKGGASIGAVIIDAEGALVGEGHSLVAPDCDPISHAEVNAIRAATKRLGRFHLPDCTLYSTLEPCSMCLGATAWAGLGEVVFGADGSVTPERYYDRVDYCAIRASRDARRDGDRQPLLIQGRVLFDETALLLGSSSIEGLRVASLVA
jgi:tRNA(adenine34) deaminase